jgi:cobalt/nickel transport system permease protein
MISESFAVGTSMVHRLDPRLRIVFAAVFSFLVAFSKQFPTLIAALIVSMALVYMSAVELSEVARRLKIVNLFNLIVWAILPLTYEGEPVFHIWRLAGSREGIVLSAQITFKSNAILMAFIAVVATMSLATLGHALNRLRVPNKIVYLLLMAYRYVFVIEQEYTRLSRAARVRGFSPKTDLHTYKTFAYMLGMLLVRAMARADRVYQAMLCRGFKGKFYCIHTFRFARLDVVWTCLMLATIIMLGIFEWHMKI